MQHLNATCKCNIQTSLNLILIQLLISDSPSIFFFFFFLKIFQVNELLLAEMKKTFSKSKQQDLLKQIQAIHNKQLLKGIAQQNTM